MIEHFIQRVSTFFTAEHRKENAAAKNRIDKSCRVTCEQPAIPVQMRASIGKIRFDVDIRNAPRIRHPFCNSWLFRQRSFEKIISAELAFTKRFTVENHSDARPVVGKRNQPEP